MEYTPYSNKIRKESKSVRKLKRYTIESLLLERKERKERGFPADGEAPLATVGPVMFFKFLNGVLGV